MISRRDVAKSAFALPLLHVYAGSPWARGLFADDDLGVASGSPTPDGFVIWTRVPNAVLDATSATVATVRYEVGSSPEFQEAEILRSGEVETGAARDFTVKVRLEGLAPFTTYYYRFSVAGEWTSVVGRTKTAPALGSSPAGVKIAAVTCQRFSGGYYTAYAHLAQEPVDYVVHLGDHIYEHEAGRGGQGDPLGDRPALSLADYRAKYRYYLSDPNYREVRRLFPFVDLWDDHEVVNDHAGARDVPKAPDRFAAGYQAFLEYMPVELDLVYDRGRELPHVEAYRSYRFGDLLELVVLDQRQYRMPNPCWTQKFSPGCAAMHDANLSMLGQAQKAWLKDTLGSSRAKWKLLANEVMLSPVRFGNRYMNLDQWDGYPAEKEDVLAFLDKEQIPNVVAITGDIHAAINGYIYRDGQASGRAPVLEIVTASISTTTLGEILGKAIGPLAHRLMHSTNRHLAWSDIMHHGYTVLEISPEAMDVRHVAVDTIAEPTSGASVARRFKIMDGRPEFLV